MSNTHSHFLKEMGITEWAHKDATQTMPPAQHADAKSPDASIQAPMQDKVSLGNWWFFGVPPQGEAQVLFQNMIRVLGLDSQEWSWRSPTDPLSQLKAPDNGLPVVAFAFGGSVAQKITGEKDPLPQLRETILALNAGSEEDIPVVASFDLAHILSKPKDKSLLWQDLLLAKSVLQSI
jgi:DNA polymerase